MTRRTTCATNPKCTERKAGSAAGATVGTSAESACGAGQTGDAATAGACKPEPQSETARIDELPPEQLRKLRHAAAERVAAKL